jgi:peptidoglycan/xylan/chitin deacetylase (PgdA/CDA1 family)
MTNGVLAEREPAIVRRIADEGHEIVNHSWGSRLVVSGQARTVGWW